MKDNRIRHHLSSKQNSKVVLSTYCHLPNFLNFLLYYFLFAPIFTYVTSRIRSNKKSSNGNKDYFWILLQSQPMSEQNYLREQMWIVLYCLTFFQDILKKATVPLFNNFLHFSEKICHSYYCLKSRCCYQNTFVPVVILYMN